MSHVIVKSRPSDRPRGRFRSCDSQSFYKKSLKLYQNQPAVRPPLSENFTKKPSIFLKINPQSTSPSLSSSPPQIHARRLDAAATAPPGAGRPPPSRRALGGPGAPSRSPSRSPSTIQLTAPGSVASSPSAPPWDPRRPAAAAGALLMAPGGLDWPQPPRSLRCSSAAAGSLPSFYPGQPSIFTSPS